MCSPTTGSSPYVARRANTLVRAKGCTSLGGRAQSQWAQSLRGALELVGTGLPTLHAEIELALHQIVPVGYDESRHLSASFQENLGTAYMTLHPQRMTLVEAIVHEFSHNKLNALFEIDLVLHNAFEPLFTSPVRPDRRPLHGVLLAVHAFMAVESLYRSLREQDHPVREGPGFDRRLHAITVGNREGLQTLENAEPTAAGASLLSELRRASKVAGSSPKSAKSLPTAVRVPCSCLPVQASLWGALAAPAFATVRPRLFSSASCVLSSCALEGTSHAYC